MKHLETFAQKDIFPGKEDGREKIEFADRITGVAIIFNARNEIALISNEIHNLFLLPGGGIEEDESIAEGIIRECLEETGCIVQLNDSVGIIDDYRNRDRKHCITYCYTASLMRNEKPKPTENEARNSLRTVWMPFDKAVRLSQGQVEKLKAEEIPFYNTSFNIFRDNLFLKELQRWSNV